MSIAHSLGSVFLIFIFLTREETHVLSEPCSIGQMTDNLVVVSLSFRASGPFLKLKKKKLEDGSER